MEVSIGWRCESVVGVSRVEVTFGWRCESGGGVSRVEVPV